MKRIALIASLALGLAAAGTTQAQEALAKSSGCLTCHSVDTKKVGPSYKDTAAKYKGKADAEATLIAKLTEGKAHPATKASPADIKSLVQWVLAM
jgi:cytochrome c